MERVKKSIHLERVYNRGYFGKNVTVAIMDTGMAPHPDLRNQIVAFQDFTAKKNSIYDDNGHGTHVAGIIAGTGVVSKMKYGRCRYSGIAPEANLVILKVLDANGNGETNRVLKSFDWIIKNKDVYQIKILNISVGMLATAGETEKRALLTGVEALWDYGIMVVAAAGNNGPEENSVTIPGISRKILTVGCSDDENLVRIGKKRKKGYSGVGPTDCCVVKPEVLAPGTEIISCSTQNSYIPKSGTSMAAPVVSGVLALAYQKYPEFMPWEMKLRIYESAFPRGEQLQKKCWGMIHGDNLLGYTDFNTK